MSDEQDKKAPDAPKRASSIERAIAADKATDKGADKATDTAAAAGAGQSVERPDRNTGSAPASEPATESGAQAGADANKGTTPEDVADKWAKPEPGSAARNQALGLSPQAEPALSSSTPGADSTVEPVDEQAETVREAETTSDAESVVAPAPVKTKSGRGLAFLSLLLALGAAGGAGYLYYELIYLKPFERQLAQQLSTVEQAVGTATAEANEETRALTSRFADLEAAFTTLRGEQNSALDGALSEQQQRLESTEKSLIESLNRVANQAPPSAQEWKLAELEYLLRVANHRVLMEKDADGARRLLETADAIVAELDDFGLHDVRVALADEILALKRVGKNDVQGLFLRLEAVKRGLDGLPLRVPEYLTNPPTAGEPGTSERGVLAAFADRMGTFLQFRELETQIKPLLAPDEIKYLELNLRLMLEQAQLGALRGQPDVFEQSLDNAIDWLSEYLDADAQAVNDMVGELTALREISVARELPDISGSLRALQATERASS